MSIYAFLALLFGYVFVEAGLAARRGAGDGPLASAWAWRTAVLTALACDLYFGWPFLVV
ncbi:MAG TPA: hypothetical protein PKA64_15980 [Myxococcota bacterium]|nr:hypothetical protein [Myxococcota bacterium]